jgi:hypothetical protein
MLMLLTQTTYEIDVRQFRFCFSIAAVAYRSKTQSIAATSSTETEFLAAVSAPKTARYLRSALRDLKIGQSSATVMYIDNEPANKMINARRPTERARHFDIQ